MSKIGSEGGKSAGETLEKLKDLYASREHESELKHKSQLNELQKAHIAELDKVRVEADAKIRAVKDESAAKINQRDMRHQKEVQSMRAIYERKINLARGEPEEE